MEDAYKVSFTPRQLQSMPETHFSSLFHSANWARLTNDTKLAMCQELENRLAAADNVAPRNVVPEQMQGACYGYQQGNRIAVNVDMLNDGTFRTSYVDGQGHRVTTEHAVQAASWNVYDTIVHEHTHGVSLDRGLAPYTYFDSDTDHDLYRIQNEERLAYDAGNKATLEAISRAEAALGRQEPEKAAYLESINAENYALCLENAKAAYSDPAIDKTLAQFISDQDQGTVPEHRSESYMRLQTAYQEQIDRQMQAMMEWDKTNTVTAEPVIGNDNNLSASVTEENDGAALTAGTETVDHGFDGAAMSSAEESGDYGPDGAEMSAATESAGYGADGTDMTSGADMGGYSGGSDGGMDND